LFCRKLYGHATFGSLEFAQLFGVAPKRFCGLTPADRAQSVGEWATILFQKLIGLDFRDP